ncbi:MAG: ABC transporter ATP-binding protein [Erysipelotrichales bacterium]|nr:ABC transporter ATP-binding protein [Erysipelotrichales bacterium]
MKELLNITNKSEWILIGIYRVTIYICWFLFACAFNVFLNESITDTKLILLVLSLMIIYGIRSFFRLLYKKNASNTYYNIKHAVEMHYYSKLGSVSYHNLEEIDKGELSNKILEVSFKFTKIVSDTFEYIIPGFIGLFIIFIKLIDLNKLFGIIAFLSLIILLIYSYNHLNEEEEVITNYNDLLKEFIEKIMTIKKLNVFSYSVKKLDETRENDICILKNNDTINDIKFTNFIFVLISIILISSFIFVKNSVTRLGLIIFFIIIILKLQELLFKISPSIKNMINFQRIKYELDSYFKEEKNNQVNKSWKKINIKNGLVNYNDTTVDIKIPSFELMKKDHISILGASGQGKSTILNILSGIFTLDEGDILFDGNSSKDIVDAYYSDIPCVFNISLRDNLKFLNKVKDEVLLELIDEIGLTEWYNKLPNGLDEILNNDLDLEVSEKINILRAIISDKDIYFFDEPTSYMDNDSVNKVSSLIKKYFKDKTYIIISKKTALTNLCKKHYFIKNHTLLEKEPLL